MYQTVNDVQWITMLYIERSTNGDILRLNLVTYVPNVLSTLSLLLPRKM